MYVVIVLLQTVVLPLLFGVIEMVARPGDDIVLVFGKWFLFWGVGTRLVLAGAFQVTHPEFTVRNILGAPDASAAQIAQELGFANLAMGIVAVVATFVPDWWAAAAIPGGLYLGQAGLRHVRKPGKDREEVVATWTDLLVAAAMAVFVVWIVTHP